MNFSLSIRALMVAAFALPAVVYAQGDAAVDEIQVSAAAVSNKSLSDLRRDVWELEEEFYSIFNDLNDERDFHVKCFFETNTGTRIKNQVCRARYVINAHSAGATRGRAGGDMRARNNENSTTVAKDAEYEEQMQKFLAENADLQAALVRYSVARNAYMAKLHESDQR